MEDTERTPSLLGEAEVPLASAAGAMKLSILMPVFNELRTVAAAIAGILTTPYPCDYELIVIDDGSRDGTARILEALAHPRARVVSHPRNLGKGAALLTGAAVATGTHLVPFDADLEYDPHDLAALTVPVLQGRSEVVFGARLSGINTRFQSYRHVIGNRALTAVANVLFDAYLSDLHSCLKLLPVTLFLELDLSEPGFGLDTEITAKLLKRGILPLEVPVSYHSRSVAHGKKISWRDGIKCLHLLAQIRAGARVSRSTPVVEDPLEVMKLSRAALADLAEPRPRPELVDADPAAEFALPRGRPRSAAHSFDPSASAS